MPRTALAAMLARRPMRWCRQHERAWVQPMVGEPHWIPLPRRTLVWAQAWAQWGRCTIQVDEGACDVCQQAAEVA